MLGKEKDPYWKKRADDLVEGRAKGGSLYDRKAIKEVRKGMKQWQEKVLRPWLVWAGVFQNVFESASGIPLKPR